MGGVLGPGSKNNLDLPALIFSDGNSVCFYRLSDREQTSPPAVPSGWFPWVLVEAGFLP